MFSYVVDAPIAGQWVRLHNLQALNPTEFFWINNNNLTTATRLDFSTNSFDIQARERTLSPGESIKGWVFLEWPPELRAQVPTVRELRLTIENSHGEKQTSVLTLPTAEEAGGSIIAGGQWHVVSQQVAADLSQVPIMPHMDLLRAYREGTLK